jgi:hypothetical protein
MSWWAKLLVSAGKALHGVIGEERAMLAQAERKRQQAEELLQATNRERPDIPRQQAIAQLQSAYSDLEPILLKEGDALLLDDLLGVFRTKLWRLELLEQCWRTKFRELELQMLVGSNVCGMVEKSHDLFESCYQGLNRGFGTRTVSDYNRFSNRFEDRDVSADYEALKAIGGSKQKYDTARSQLASLCPPPDIDSSAPSA